MQEDRPLAYASRALSKSERNYSQIEKEMLAIVWGAKKFHNHTAYRRVSVETDHKPLVSIMKKPLYDVPLRLQRMRMKLQPYDLDVQYKKGKDLVIADTLSRAYLPEVGNHDDGPLEVNLVKEQTPITPEKFEKFREETSKDPVLSAVARVILDGWPDDIKQCPFEVRQYCAVREDLSLVDGVIFKGCRLVVLQLLRNAMLRKIHESHQGIVRSKQRARDVLFWPGMSAQIEDMVYKCEICNLHARKQQRQPLMSHEVPTQPWNKVACDLFVLDGTQYCLVTDFYSKYPEVINLGQSSTTKSVVNSLKTVFSRHGIPQTLVTDNGPCFASHEFKKFVQDWEFRHVISSLLYPRSNGMAEKNVQTMVSIMRKAEDPYLALLEYRTTPIDGIGLSPAQMLMGRRLNSKIPTHSSILNMFR